ncbi:MAG: hypothetical protein WCR42_05460 [bacterium]
MLILSLYFTAISKADDCVGFFDNMFKLTSISDINTNTSKFDKEEVIIEGKVSRVVNLFDKIRFYEISDGKTDKDKIHVITEKPLPAEYETITIRGTVKQAFKIGEFEFVVIQEKCRKEKKK